MSVKLNRIWIDEKGLEQKGEFEFTSQQLNELEIERNNAWEIRFSYQD